MITHVIGGKILPKEIADQIIDRTDGIPLFVEELTKAVVESGVLTETGDGYRVTGPVAPLTIPTTLHASLLARLDRLAPTREVAQTAAALGRTFSHELISTVATMSKPQLDDALAQLVSAELIFQRGTPPDAEYTNTHWCRMRPTAHCCGAGAYGSTPVSSRRLKIIFRRLCWLNWHCLPSTASKLGWQTRRSFIGIRPVRRRWPARRQWRLKKATGRG
jgi:hypothetical protein